MVIDAPERLPAYANFPALELDKQNAELHSPIVHVTADDPPTLLIAGDKDDLVPIDHNRKIQAAFEKTGVESKLVEVVGAGHGFQGEDARKSTQAMVEWFEEHLKAK